MVSSRNWAKERENLKGGIMLGLRLVVGNVVLSLRPRGDALTRGLNEVRRKINGGV